MSIHTKELLEKLIESVQKDETFGSTVLLEDAASGDSIPAAHLTKIRKWTQKDTPAESIHTYPVLMIDDAPTRNLVIYTAESQKKTAKRWPGTTFLFNAAGTQGLFDGGPDHKLQAASQMARIYDAKLVNTPKGNIGTLAWFYTVSGIDENIDAFIGKLDAGILREVSIHISAPEGVICSVCNDSFSKCFENSGADHYPGDKDPKSKKTVYMSTGVGGLIPLELSAVACPGSVNAHVMQDDEVEDYPVVSLREALGGSDEAIQQIQQEKIMRTTEQIAEARIKLAEAAKAAGVEVRAFVENAENKEMVEAADVTVETVETVFAPVPENVVCEKCSKEHVKTETHVCETAPIVEPKPKAHSLVGETEECVVCGRGPIVQTEETAQIATLRTEFKTAITSLTEKSQAVIDAANAKAEEAETRSKDALAMFDDFIETTVSLAIKFGAKKSSEKEAYRETLAGLPYQAVKEIRESYRGREIAEVKISKVSQLQETAAERAKRELGQTQTTTSENGRTRSTTQRPRFGAQ